MTASLLGFLLGLKHALEADHLAAVAALAADEVSPWGMVRQAFYWALGHSLMLLLVAGSLLALGATLAPQLSAALETAVGVVLVVLGLRLVLRNSRWGTRWQPALAAGADVTPTVRDSRPALLIGMLHGTAGSAVLILITMQASQSFGHAVGYIALFGLGSIAGMLCVSGVLALPLRELRRNPKHWPLLERVLGAATVVVGLMLALSTISGGS
ncbi:MAG: hypothetical protein AAF918_17955 [Pseudomonadota bacterium]